MFAPEIRNAIASVASDLGVEPAALAAVVEVESAGRLFADIDGRREPLIRFEGHYFHQRLSGRKLELAVARGLASPRAGQVANPTTQTGRWRLLAEAEAIDQFAARESVSWGAGQVMGAHWKRLGYGSVEELVDEARRGAEGQLRLMARFIDRNRLGNALARRDWVAFARGYNGPAFSKNAYDRKLSDAYRRRLADFRKDPEGRPSQPVLRQGDRGPAVSDLQAGLTALGYPLVVDGWFGTRTRKALAAFQGTQGLATDGIAGPLTLAALRSVTSVDKAVGG